MSRDESNDPHAAKMRELQSRLMEKEGNWRKPSVPRLLWSRGVQSYVGAVALSFDGSLVAVGGDGLSVRRASDGEIVTSAPGGPRWVRFAPQGTSLSFCRWFDPYARILDAANGNELAALGPADSTVLASAFNGDGEILAAASRSEITVWRWRDATRLAALPVEEGGFAVAISPQAGLLAATDRSSIRVYRVSDWSPVTVLLDPEGLIQMKVGFSGDGRLLLAGQTAISAWDTTTWAPQPLSLYPALGFNVSGDRAITSGWEGEVAVTNLASGSQIVRWTAHLSRVSAVALSADGRLAVTGGDTDDPTVKLWRLDG